MDTTTNARSAADAMRIMQDRVAKERARSADGRISMLNYCLYGIKSREGLEIDENGRLYTAERTHCALALGCYEDSWKTMHIDDSAAFEALMFDGAFSLALIENDIETIRGRIDAHGGRGDNFTESMLDGWLFRVIFVPVGEEFTIRCEQDELADRIVFRSDEGSQWLKA